MHLFTAGDGPAILLLHAFPLDGRMWRGQISELATGYRVLAPDMPGFGRSIEAEGGPSLDEWGKRLIAMCREQGVTSAVVGGCSMGGYLSFAMHRLAPSFIAGFALINTRAAADTQDGRRARYEMVERARHEGTAFLLETPLPLSPQTFAHQPEIVAFAREIMADATPVGIMAAQRAMASRKDARPQLPGIGVPAVVVYGVDDPVIAREEAESMAAAIPGARFVPVEHAGHLSPMEKPIEVSAAIRSVAAQAFAQRP